MKARSAKQLGRSYGIKKFKTDQKSGQSSRKFFPKKFKIWTVKKNGRENNAYGGSGDAAPLQQLYYDDTIPDIFFYLPHNNDNISTTSAI